MALRAARTSLEEEDLLLEWRFRAWMYECRSDASTLREEVS